MLSSVVYVIQPGCAAAEHGLLRALGLSEGPWSPAHQNTAMGHCHPLRGYTSCFLRNRLKAVHYSLAAMLPAIHRFLGKNGSLPSLLCMSLYTSAGPQHETSAISSCRGAADGIADFPWERNQPKEEGNSLVLNHIYFSFSSLTLPGDSSVQHSQILICLFLGS